MPFRRRRSVGPGSIDWSFNVFDIPFFFDSYDELNYVTDKLTPVLRKRVEPKGFMLLNWGHGGWTQLFTKKPVLSLDDLKHTKLWTSAGNDRMVQWYKANGFEPRAMAMTDILTGLTTNMIDVIPTCAGGEPGGTGRRHTLELGPAPVVGAGVMTRARRAFRRRRSARGGGRVERLRVEEPKLDAS